MLRLADAVFIEGCTGRNLDILARGPVWKKGTDYKCGTGHGVGYMLGVHTGPQNIRYRYIRDVEEAVLLDLDLIDTAYMEPHDIELLNEYHDGVYKRLEPHMKDDKEWKQLNAATRHISR